jgi:Flp pilus assembly pilin Flp
MTSYRTEQGQGLVEYGLILVLVAIIAVLILSTLASAVGDVLNTVVAELNTASGGSGDPPPTSPPPPPTTVPTTVPTAVPTTPPTPVPTPTPPPVCYGSGMLPTLLMLMAAMLVFASWQTRRQPPLLNEITI